MAAGVVGASPVGRRVVTVRRKKRDATRVVVSAAERVLNLPGEKFAGFAAKRELEGIAFQVSLGLHLPDLAQGRVRAHVVTANQNGGIGVDGAEEVNAASANIDGAERALSGDLAFHSCAVLQGVGNAQVGI